MRRDQRGFTLLELLLALAIVGALVVIAFGGVRIALASWRQGEERAEAYQHLRGVALTLARTVYDERRWELLPLLADLLEEAGCPAEVSAHCRGPGPHVRGCWVVDLLLGQR